MAFSTKIKGHRHVQGNVQVYNVRIPVAIVAYLGLLCRDPFEPSLFGRPKFAVRSFFGTHGLDVLNFCLWSVRGSLGLFRAQATWRSHWVLSPKGRTSIAPKRDPKKGTPFNCPKRFSQVVVG